MEKKDTKAEETVAKAPVFSLGKLKEHSLDVFGVSSCVFAGATHGMTGEHSVEEIKAVIKAWLKKGVR